MKIALVGEALNDLDDGEAFSGVTGWHLDKLLAAAGIARRECFTTVVFNLVPKGGNVKSLCGTKKQGVPGRPPLQRGKYVRAEYANELKRLDETLNAANPNIIVALGATALWALTGEMGIKAARGVCRLSTAGVKVLPTYDPGAVVRQWTLRPIVIADLQKAVAQSAFPEYVRPERRIYIPDTIPELLAFEKEHFTTAKLACDIETKQEQITCIGFSPDPSRAIVIPFFRHNGSNYWQTREEELAAWEIIARWLRDYPTVYQNGIYDMSFLWRVYGIPAPLAVSDTMLMHHALQPEMDKGLGFLASLYTDEPSWKQMGKGMKHD